MVASSLVVLRFILVVRSSPLFATALPPLFFETSLLGSALLAVIVSWLSTSGILCVDSPVILWQGWKNPVAWSPFATKKHFWRPDHRPRWSIWRLTFRPRVQFGDPSFALGSMCEQTVLHGDRKTNDRFPKTKFKISKRFLLSRNVNLAHSHTPAPPPPSKTVVPFVFW